MRKLFVIFGLVTWLSSGATGQKTIYVAVNGSDENNGSRELPFATLFRAEDEVREILNVKVQPVNVLVGGGTYYLSKPLVFGPENSGTAKTPVRYIANGEDIVTLSGGIRLDCKWEPYKDGIMMCELEEVKKGELSFHQLFIDGKRNHLARYPDYDMSEPGQTGYVLPEGIISDETLNPEPYEFDDMTQHDTPPLGIIYNKVQFTSNQWNNPEEAIIHIYQGKHWGNLQWTIKDVDFEKQYIWFGKGGHQIGAKWHSNPISLSRESQFFIENVFEELDAPGEWYLDRDNGILYCIPEKGVDLQKSIVEAPVLERMIQFSGDQYDPVQHISLEGFRLTHTTPTFLKEYSVPSGSDWAIHRGGAVFMEGAQYCSIKDCWFDAL